MTINFPGMLGIASGAREVAWDESTSSLYGLAIGMAGDPLDKNELRFVYEADMSVVPTMATVIAWGTGPALSSLGIDLRRVVHARQRVDLHKPLASRGKASAVGFVREVVDRGDKGALIEIETQLRDSKSGEAMVTLVTSILARGDGGFGGPPTARSEPVPKPDRAPDLTATYPTRPDQALLYRLLGDRNPLHADLDFARAAGFPRPILHGLCTYGIMCRGVLQHFAGYDPTRIGSVDVRFTAPVFPGDTIAIDYWADRDAVRFEARVPERGATIIKDGRATITERG